MFKAVLNKSTGDETKVAAKIERHLFGYVLYQYVTAASKFETILPKSEKT